jgi:hypothetical protein
MRTLVIWLTAIYLLTISISAQSSASTDIVWKHDEGCGNANPSEIKAQGPVCQRVEAGRETFYIITYKGISVAASFAAPRAYLRMRLQITNRSGGVVNFAPNDSRVDIYVTESSYRKGKRTDSVSEFISPEDAKARYIKYESSLKIVSPGMGSIFADTRPVTDSTPKNPAKPGETGAAVNQPIIPIVRTPTPVGSKPNVIDPLSLTRFDQAIPGGPIPDEQKAAGYVFFEPIKERIHYLVFRIRVGDLIFVFPEETQKDAKRLAEKK